MTDPDPLNPQAVRGFEIAEVRYLLAGMLKEVEYERKDSNLGREKVDQAEIQKLFKKKRRRAR